MRSSFRSPAFLTLGAALGLSAALPMAGLSAATATAAMSATAATPFAELRVADGADLVAHWNGSVLGRVWSDPAAEPLREKARALLSETNKRSGLDLLALIAGMKSFHLRYGGMPTAADGTRSLALSLQADLGPQCATVFTQLAKTAGKDATAATSAAGVATLTYRVEKTAVVSLAPIVAMHGTTLVMSFDGRPPEPWKAPAATGDVFLRGDFGLIAAEFLRLAASANLGLDMPGADMPFAAMGEEMAKRYTGDFTYRADLVPEGVTERFTTSWKEAGQKPVDLTLVGRLPATTLMAAAVGLDGATYWKENRGLMLRQWSAGTGLAPDAPLDEIENVLNAAPRQVGLNLGLSGIASAFTGTTIVAITPGMPVPGFTLVLPRNAESVEIFRFLLKQYGDVAPFLLQGQAVPSELPAEGGSIVVPLPAGAPVQLSLLADTRSFVLTTDVGIAQSWMTAAHGGWNDAPAMKAALDRARKLAPNGPVIIGASDTPQVIRLGSQLAQLALGMSGASLSPEDRTLIFSLLGKLAAQASTGYFIGGQTAGGQIQEIRSLTGMITAYAGLVGAFAIPALLESRVQANAAAAANTLKSGIYPAQIQFMAGAYMDADNDGRGEAGFLDELSGNRDAGTANRRLSLLTAKLSAGAAHNGYRYAIFLPDGNGGALGDPAAGAARPTAANQAGIDAQEQVFVAYAWPENSDAGTEMFALTHNGNVYISDADPAGAAPAWNAVFGGGTATFTDAPAWAPYRSDPPPVQAVPIIDMVP